MTSPNPADRRPAAARTRGAWFASAATLALLLFVAADAHGRSGGEGAASFAKRARDVAPASFPYSVGEWLGSDAPTTPAAMELLRPAVVVSRGYESLRTGEQASLLFVCCTDARDLLGHHPPVCYPAQGKTLVSAQRRDWDVAGRRVEGMRYRFSGIRRDGPEEFVVDSFVVLPGGRIGRDMAAIEALARDRRQRRSGAATVQVVTDGALSDARRDEALRTLLAPALPLFEPRNAP